MDGLYSIDQLKPNFNFNIPRLMDMENWRLWRHGLFDGLMPRRNVITGSSLFEKRDMVELHLGAVSSDYYADATLANGPTESGSERALALYRNRQTNISRVLRLSVDDWSWAGLGILVGTKNNEVLRVDPRFYMRIGEIWDNDAQVIHILAYRYYEPDPGEAQIYPATVTNVVQRVPNRCRLIIFDPRTGVSTDQVFMMAGNILGKAITPYRQSNISWVATFGDVDSWYPQIRTIWAQIMIRLTNNLRTLNIDDQRPSIWPEQAIQALDQYLAESVNLAGDEVTQTPRPSISSRQNLVNWLMGMPAPALFLQQGLNDQRGGRYGRLGEPYAFEDGRLAVRFLFDAYSLASGVAFTSFGYGIGARESGEAREQAQTRAAARVTRVREQLVKALGDVLASQGINVTFGFDIPPFVLKSAFIADRLEWWMENVITMNEFRESAGLPPREDGDFLRSQIMSGSQTNDASVIIESNGG